MNPGKELMALQYLRRRYLDRKNTNPSYSLSSFARDLGLSRSFICRVMAGDRPVTVKLATQLSAIFGVSANETEAWTNEIILNSPPIAKISQKVRDQIRDKPPALYEIRDFELERFRVISHWYHLAILNLTYLKNFKSEPAWIGK